MQNCTLLYQLENISFGVKDEKGEKEIIKNLNLSIGENKFVVITGPNGGGKSTLAKLIAGIEKPVSGRILFDQEDITEKSMELAQAGTLSSNEDYARDIREEYENHMAPAADLLFVVTSPDFSDSSAINLTSYVDDDGITHYSAYFSVTISMRSIDELATDIMGFWSGDLSGIGVSQSEDDTAQEPEDELEEEPAA